MKTALFIQDGQLQVVLTPTVDSEQAILNLVEKKEKVSFHRGSFYECNGGWTRYRESWENSYGDRISDTSLIITLRDPRPEEA